MVLVHGVQPKSMLDPILWGDMSLLGGVWASKRDLDWFVVTFNDGFGS